MLLYILFGLGTALALFVGVVAMRPSEFHVERSQLIAAPPVDVYRNVYDFRNWETWNPWAKQDPDIQQIYEGAPAGEGAIYLWKSKIVGEGRMTMTEDLPNEVIRIRLEFFKPFKGDNRAEFRFEPASEGTRATWSMDGRSGFVPKMFGMFVSMDTMIGTEFEKGLGTLKSVVESAKD
jgi:hypothetical protein